jgi:hypothetical protein
MDPPGRTVTASPSVTVIPEPEIVKEVKVLAAVISVLIPVIVIVPVCVYVIPATSVTLPAILMFSLPAIVPVNPVQLIDLAPVFPALIVQVPVEAASKNTSSADVGTA